MAQRLFLLDGARHDGYSRTHGRRPRHRDHRFLPKGIEAAIEEGLHRASKTLRGITGVEVLSVKAKVVKGKVQEYRVSLKITFVLED